MIEPDPSASQTASTPTPGGALHWPSILAAVGGTLAVLTFLTGAFLFFLAGVLNFVTPDPVEAGGAGLLFSYAAAGFALSLLVLPAVVLAARRLSGKSTGEVFFTRRLTRRHAGWLLIVYLLVLIGGILLSNLPQLDWLFMPVLNVLALSLPVILLLWLGTKDLTPSSTQRNWTAFGLGLTVSPLIILTLELLAIFTGIIAIVVVLTVFIPDMPAQLEEFARMMETAQSTMQFPEDELIGFLKSPVVVAVILFFTSALVPLVEESIKPIGLWLLGGRKLTPQDGWVLGLLSGAGFALIENLGNLAVGQGWASLALARGGASALHMFNSAIIGYTFVLSRRQKRWRTVILAFSGTLLLHALWNSTAVMALIATLQDPSGAEVGWPIGYLLVLGLASTGTTWGIHRVNRKLVGETEIIIESE